MKASFIGVFGGSADHAGLLTLEFPPSVQSVATQAIQHKQSEKDHGRVNIHGRNAQSNEHNDHKWHTLLHADVFETVKRRIGHHGEA